MSQAEWIHIEWLIKNHAPNAHIVCDSEGCYIQIESESKFRAVVHPKSFLDLFPDYPMETK